MNPESPYKGLVPFEDSGPDALLFFGRERESAVIAENLLAAKLTVLYGPSGVGKTSVLRAGVAHRLREQARVNVDERGHPEFTVVVFDSWSEEPTDSLRAAARDALSAQFGSALLDEMDGESLGDTFRRWTDALACDLLLILDQAEEYFLYHQAEGGFALELPGPGHAAGPAGPCPAVAARRCALQARPLQGPHPESVRELPTARPSRSPVRPRGRRSARGALQRAHGRIDRGRAGAGRGSARRDGGRTGRSRHGRTWPGRGRGERGSDRGGVSPARPRADLGGGASRRIRPPASIDPRVARRRRIDRPCASSARRRGADLRAARRGRRRVPFPGDSVWHEDRPWGRRSCRVRLSRRAAPVAGALHARPGANRPNRRRRGVERRRDTRSSTTSSARRCSPGAESRSSNASVERPSVATGVCLPSPSARSWRWRP